MFQCNACMNQNLHAQKGFGRIEQSSRYISTEIYKHMFTDYHMYITLIPIKTQFNTIPLLGMKDSQLSFLGCIACKTASNSSFTLSKTFGALTSFIGVFSSISSFIP